MTQLQLSKNLTLNTIEANNFSGDELKAVVCYFTFFGEDGTAYISMNRIENEYPSYGIVEICSELMDSFSDMVDDNWDEVVKHVKKFEKQFKKENA